MLIGAGSAGQMIFRDLKASKETNEKLPALLMTIRISGEDI